MQYLDNKTAAYVPYSSHKDGLFITASISIPVKKNAGKHFDSVC